MPIDFERMAQEPPPDEQERAGAFDDLLDPPKPAPAAHGTAARGREATAQIQRLIARAIADLEAGKASAPRDHTCLRCQAVADAAMRRGEPPTPVRPVEQWKVDGRTYYAATCRPCTDYEWSEMWQRRYNLAVKVNNTREQKRLTDIVNERLRGGRKFYGTVDLAKIQAAVAT